MRHDFHPTILRSYDIRGIVGETLGEPDAFAIGLGFASLIRRDGGQRVAVGRDGRLSSPMLAEALIKGLCAGGMTVLDAGLGPTPMLYFADHHLNTDGAIQVTGSHNPPSHNGFKMVMGHKPFFGEDIQELGRIMAAGVDEMPGGSTDGADIHDTWINYMQDQAGDLSMLADKTVIWDCGNGAAGPSVLALTDALAGNHQVLFPEIDGTFPNHHPDPVDPETLEFLRQRVAESGASLGIGFDGDGDRIGLIDCHGRQIPGDLLTAYLARRVLRKEPGAEVIFDVKSSLAALDAVAAMGGKPGLWKTGHSHMKIRLKETAAPIAGEMSGHIFISHGYLGFDDALFAALAVLREWAESGESIDAFIDSLPPVYATPELRIACPDEEKFQIVDRVIADVRANPDQDQQNLADMDGIRVTGDEGWWLIRASNTGAQLVARAEGRNEASRDMLKQRIRQRLAGAGLEWQG
ncbi:MAG: phosphomannomutase [SAR116 cluster bacterium MED-G04]|jgi:phosphomannomutase|nr:MAG: phosphomannomutase [SAR116 cluster bacterium MED-G04]HCD50296.1 phosphomannomutase/phosphoglucomutase [Alphaproteobacteria bacterium]|tara:strand:+ start:1572 stop:2966 length:1395 start_codon:yes stop_codon:yes gene_type:complete